MLKARYQHSNGQLPAYEWNFGDVNPPVHAWATLFQYRIEQAQRGEGDVEFLKRAFGKLLINFTWWVNRKDRLGKSVFEGGFLGLDNIGDLRPQRRAAHRRPPRAGRRHRLDGDVLPEHVRDRDRARSPRRQLRRPRLQVRRALPLDRRRHEQGGRRRHVGRGGRLLLRRPAPAGRQRRASQGPLARRAVAALCHDRHRTVAARARAAGRQVARDAVPPHSRAPRRYPPDRSRAHEFRRPDHCGARRCRPVAADPLAHAGRTGIPEPLRHPLGIAVARAASIRRARGREGVPRSPISQPSRTAGCSAGTPTGAAPCGSR